MLDAICPHDARQWPSGDCHRTKFISVVREVGDADLQSRMRDVEKSLMVITASELDSGLKGFRGFADVIE
jgi:hypothetical protein